MIIGSKEACLYLHYGCVDMKTRTHRATTYKMDQLREREGVEGTEGQRGGGAEGRLLDAQVGEGEQERLRRGRFHHHVAVRFLWFDFVGNGLLEVAGHLDEVREVVVEDRDKAVGLLE